MSRLLGALFTQDSSGGTPRVFRRLRRNASNRTLTLSGSAGDIVTIRSSISACFSILISRDSFLLRTATGPEKRTDLLTG